MNIHPNEKILEIGCGTGVAVERIASILTKGTITAIDRSDTMIKKAVKRNLQGINDKKVNIHRCELLQMRTDLKYDKLFCFNVNLFWTIKSIKKEADILNSVITPKGLLYIFYGPLFGKGINKDQSFDNKKSDFGKKIHH